MPDSSRLIVVSNRLPVALVREDTKWKTKRTAGGLATAMDPILKRAGGIWIGWSGAEEDLPPEAVDLLHQEQSCIAVELPADLLKKFYEGYANQALWPLFHSFTSKLQFDSESWEAYIEANRRFCSAVVREFQPGDRIWVHDYHLMLLPSMLREKPPGCSDRLFPAHPISGLGCLWHPASWGGIARGLTRRGSHFFPHAFASSTFQDVLAPSARGSEHSQPPRGAGPSGGAASTTDRHCSGRFSWIHR